MNVRIKWLIWLSVVAFLFYEFFIRVFPAAMVSELMLSFSARATAIGTLSAFYFYGYAPMQLPVGLLLDRFGARKLLVLASLCSAIGCFFFAIADHLALAELGRWLMGIGSAIGFVGMVYVCAHWFEPRRVALMVGLGNSLGMLGAVAAEGPLGAVLQYVPWRRVVFVLAALGVLLALVFFILLRARKAQPPKEKPHVAALLVQIKRVCLNSKTWVNALIALLFYSLTAAFASLWGVPFMRQRYAISDQEAGFLVSMVFVGWIVGGPLIGMFASSLLNKKKVVCWALILTCFSFLAVVYLPVPMWMSFALLFAVGFFSAAELLHFTLAVEVNDRAAKGTAIAMTNFVVSLGSSMVQPLIGWLLDLNWDGTLQGNARLYSLHDYRMAFLVLVLALVLALVLSLRSKVWSAQSFDACD